MMKNIATALIIMATATGNAAAQPQPLDRDMVEKPSYTVSTTIGAIEIRQYAPYIVAEVSLQSGENNAMMLGFRPLADYIFGQNISQEKIEMTSPVVQQSQKIEMTSPVIQSADASGGTNQMAQRVQFMMPKKYTLQTLPAPKNPDVTLKAIPAQTLAAISFSGIGAMAEMHAKEQELRDVLRDKGFEVTGEPLYARYDPPWVAPNQRLNEVLIPVRPQESETK
jgi:hypothetical protein